MSTQPNDPPPADPPPGNDPPPTDPPSDPPTDPPDGGGTENATDDAGNDLGYPKDTAIADMSTGQQAAYWRHHAQKHEKAWRGKLGRDLTPEQYESQLEELEKFRRDKRTEAENAVEDAKKAARAEAANEYGHKLARMAFDAAMAHVDKDKRAELIDNLNLSRFIDSSGEVDTDKVREVANTIAPADTDAGGHVDFGGGRRQTKKSSGVDAGAELFAQSRKRATPTST